MRSLLKSDFYYSLLSLAGIVYVGYQLTESFLDHDSILTTFRFITYLICCELFLYKSTHKFLAEIRAENISIPSENKQKSKEEKFNEWLARGFGLFFLGLMSCILFWASKYYNPGKQEIVWSDPLHEIFYEIAYMIFPLQFSIKTFENELLSIFKDKERGKKSISLISDILLFSSFGLLMISTLGTVDPKIPATLS